MDLFGILVYVNVNVTNHVMLENVYLNSYAHCKCRKILIDKLVEECSENIDENELVYNATFNDYEKVCNSCTICIVLLTICFIIDVYISSICFYFHWYLRKSNTGVSTETVIYLIYKWKVSKK